MKNVAVAIFCFAMFFGVVFLTVEHKVELEPTLYNYFIEHGTEETGAQNIVAGILLNYRMYDTVFEAMILLTSVMGMLHFLYTGHGHGGGHSKKSGKEATQGGQE